MTVSAADFSPANGMVYAPGTHTYPSEQQLWAHWHLNQGMMWGSISSAESTLIELCPPTGFRASGIGVGHAGLHLFYLQFSTAILPTDFYHRTIEHSRFKIHSIKVSVVPHGHMHEPPTTGPVSTSEDDTSIYTRPRLPGLSERYTVPAGPAKTLEGGDLQYTQFVSYPMRTMSVRPHFSPGKSTVNSVLNSFVMSAQEALDRAPLFDIALRKWGRAHRDHRVEFTSVPKEIVVPDLTTDDPIPGSAAVLPDTMNPIVRPLDWVDIPKGGFYNAVYCADFQGNCKPPASWPTTAQPLPPLTTPLGHVIIDTSQWPNSRVPTSGQVDSAPNWGVNSILPNVGGVSARAYHTNFWQRFDHATVTATVPATSGWVGAQRPFNPPRTWDVIYEIDVEFDGVPQDAESFQDDANPTDPLVPAPPVPPAAGAGMLHSHPPTLERRDGAMDEDE